MKHTAPPSDVLVLKRKGHKSHHRRKTRRNVAKYFWGFLCLAAVGVAAMVYVEMMTRQMNSVQAQEEIISNMKTILAALEEYHKEHGQYPPAFGTNMKEDRTLSWRVAILPYFKDANGHAKYQELYDSFTHDETWNHKDNWNLLDKMPHEYRSPISKRLVNGEEAGHLTNYVAIRHPDSVFPEDLTPVSKSRITNRLEDTVLFVEVGDEDSFEWTKPDDFYFDPTRSSTAAPKGFEEGVLVCGMASGDVKVVRTDVDVSQLFQQKPKLSPEELTQKNPWVGMFLKTAAPPKEEETEAPEDGSLEKAEGETEKETEIGTETNESSKEKE